MQETSKPPPKTLLRNKLEFLFDELPVTDCMVHPTETEICKSFISNDSSRMLNWLTDFVSDSTKPIFAASVFRCVSRFNPIGNSEWRAKVVATALGSKYLETREAGVRAAESWADSELRTLLMKHNEQVEWLRDYVDDVIDDLVS